MEIEFPLDVKHSIVTGICSESGVLDSRCFDSAIEYVKSTVENHFFADFIQSEYNAKHQVCDVATSDLRQSSTTVHAYGLIFNMGHANDWCSFYETNYLNTFPPLRSMF